MSEGTQVTNFDLLVLNALRNGEQTRDQLAKETSGLVTGVSRTYVVESVGRLMRQELVEYSGKYSLTQAGRDLTDTFAAS